jgi:hypothetical protein
MTRSEDVRFLGWISMSAYSSSMLCLEPGRVIRIVADVVVVSAAAAAAAAAMVVVVVVVVVVVADKSLTTDTGHPYISMRAI